MTAAAPFEFSGGALCLDFVNTLGDRPHATQERLGEAADVVRWAREAGIVSGDEAQRASDEASRSAAAGRRALARAVDVRERLFRIFAALAAGDRPAAEDLEPFNRDLTAALPHLRIDPSADGFGWGWAAGDTGEARFERLLWPVVRSAADLLTSDEVGRVRQCASETCSWLFVDRSRTHRRRWCDMKSCGNRAKARRHYARRKRARASAGAGGDGAGR